MATTDLPERHSDEWFKLQRRKDIRAWRPGDGLTCWRAKAAPKDVPCGPPIAHITGWYSTYRTNLTPRTYVVCRNHLPGLPLASEVQVDAEKAAREELIVAHWDAYQELLAKHVESLQRESLPDLPEELRTLLLAGGDTEEAAS